MATMDSRLPLRSARTKPLTDIPLIIQRSPRQHETDMRFLQRLATRNGFVFFVEPIAPGASRAYFGPENRLGILQSAITINMGSATNVESLDLGQDALA